MEFPIYLVGYMGAGKTTIGKILADKLGWHFVDLDEAFHEIHGLSPADYIRTFGLEEFRRKEKYVVEDLAELPYQHVVYATGGGYPCWEDNMECLHELGTSFYLRWKPEHLAQRLLLTDLEDRPLLQGRTEQELLEFIRPQLEVREEFYAQADYIIDVPVESISEDDDLHIAEQLFNIIKRADNA